MNGFSNTGVPGSCVAIDMITKKILCNIVVGSGAGGGVGQTVYYQNRLFIPNLWDGSVSVINTNSNQLIGTFNVGGQVRALTYVEGTNTLYIANQGAAIAGVLNYQQADRYTLQNDLVSWDKTTAVSKMGDYIEGVLNYKNDYSSVMSSRSIPDVGYINTYTITTSDLIGGVIIVPSASAQTNFPVTFPAAPNGYTVSITPASATASANYYIASVAPGSFDVIYSPGLTGYVSFHWLVLKNKS
jgi:hypothetical protein